MRPPAHENDPEARITALLLGELNPTEAAEVQSAIAKDPDLAALHDRLKQTIAFVRSVIGRKSSESTQGQPASAEQRPRLSEEKRQTLLKTFKVVPLKRVESKRPESAKPRKRPRHWVVVPIRIAAILVLAALLAAVILPNRVKARYKMSSILVKDNLQQIDGAKQQWALENQKSADDVPTWEDIDDYLGRGERQLPSVRGEEYRPGRVGESPVAVVDGQRIMRLQDGDGVGLGSGPALAEAPQYIRDSRSDFVEPDLAQSRFGVAAEPEPADRRYYFRGLAESASGGVAGGAGGQGGLGGGGFGDAGRASGMGTAASTSTSGRERSRRPSVEIALPTKPQEESLGLLPRGSDQPALPASGSEGEQRASERWDMPTGTVDEMRRGGVELAGRNLWREQPERAPAARAQPPSAPRLGDTPIVGRQFQAGNAFNGVERYTDAGVPPATSPAGADADGSIIAGYALSRPKTPAPPPSMAGDVRFSPDGTRLSVELDALADAAVENLSLNGTLKLSRSSDGRAAGQSGLPTSQPGFVGGRAIGAQPPVKGVAVTPAEPVTVTALVEHGGEVARGASVNYAFDVDMPAEQTEARKRLLKPEPAPAPISAGIVSGKSAERVPTEAAGTEAMLFHNALAVEISGPEMGSVALRQSTDLNKDLALDLKESKNLSFGVELGEPLTVARGEVRSEAIEAEASALQFAATLNLPALAEIDAKTTLERKFVDQPKAEGRVLEELERLHEVEPKLNERESLEASVVEGQWYAKSAGPSAVVRDLEDKALKLGRVAESKPVIEEQLVKALRQVEPAQAAQSELKEIEPAPPAQPKTLPPVPQPEVSTSDNPFSTFSLNVADVSFKLAAASLERDQMPDPASIRTEEFINAFEYHDPEPSPGRRVGVAWERTRYPFAHNRDLLRLGVQTAAQGREAARPLNVVLCVDNSGSMERADRVTILHEAMKVLGGQLQPGDRISVVAFARTARLWVDGLSGAQAGELADRLGKLNPEGGTNLEDALELAYATARRHFVPSGVNRVVLLTDGAANLGNVDPEGLRQSVIRQRKDGIALDSFGVGWEGFNDDLLETLSRNGDGRYGFLNTPEEAATEFADQLAGALRVAASDVKVQVEFNPRRVKAYRQIGYAKHQLTKEQFRDNTVDAAEIGAAESGNALYVIETDANGTGPVGVVRVRFKVPETGQVEESEWMIPHEGAAVDLMKASPAMRLAAAASAFSEWLAGNPYAAEVTPPRLLELLRGVPELRELDPRPKQLEWMIRQAGSIAGQ